MKTGLTKYNLYSCHKCSYLWTIKLRVEIGLITFVKAERFDDDFVIVMQEEYENGDDIGSLDCGHDFHTCCIKEWLTQKNLCPICKMTALSTWQILAFINCLMFTCRFLRPHFYFYFEKEDVIMLCYKKIWWTYLWVILIPIG